MSNAGHTPEHILARAEEYVQELYSQYHQPYLTYHNLIHATDVAKHTRQLCSWHAINRLETSILVAAAWFHDVGHLFTDPENHEAKSAAMMVEFFEEQLDKDIIAEVQNCIMATKSPVHPKNLLEEIICDADTYHVGTHDFWNINCTVWMEEEARRGYSIPDWKKRTIAFLETHYFFTEYCNTHLAAGKRVNLKKLHEISDDSSCTPWHPDHPPATKENPG